MNALNTVTIYERLRKNALWKLTPLMIVNDHSELTHFGS